MRSLRTCRSVSIVLLALAAAGCQPAAPAATRPAATASVTAPPPASATAEASVTLAPTATPPCRGQQGELIEDRYESDLLGKAVPLWLYRPACLGNKTEGPVVYLLHGKPYDESHWPSLGLIEAYEHGLAEDRWPAALLVMPQAPEPLFSSSDGGPSSYEQEFIEAVVPYVENSYLADGSRPRRILVGISRGGIWSLEIGLRQPDRFSVVAALSPSLAVNYPRPAYDPFELAQTGAGYPDELFLLAGEEDWARQETERLYQTLASQGAPVEFELVAGDHSDATWSQAMDLVLEHLFAGLDAP